VSPFLSTEPLCIAVYAAAVMAAGCWLLSVIFREYSWVDRLWSVAPALYAAWFCYAGGFTPRLTLMATLIALWAGRLTYNFARKGGYAKGGEDYRWEVMRSKMGPVTWQIFNVVFVCGFQHALILGFTVPVWMALQQEPSPLGAGDVVVAGAFLFFLVGETIADQQQWAFQTRKKARLARGERITEQFVTTGLFRYSRHPNFFCEMAIWWTVYAFSITAGAPWLNVSIAGVAVLVLVFLGSTPLTESITRRKYPEYAQYQRTTSRLIPWFPRR
jgi:steroid 5-alpha reductase family enzyme